MSVLPAITSSHNPFFRNCLKLREGRHRRRMEQFLIDGAVEITRAVEAGIFIERLLIDSQQPPEELLRQIAAKSIPVQELSPALLGKLSYGQVENQPIAIARTPSLPLNSLKLDRRSIVLVLDRTEKPGNLGACLRSAAAAGVSAVVLTNPICDPFNPNVIRASRGTMFRLPMAIADTIEFIELAERIALPVFTARVDAVRSLWDVSLGQGAAIVFGNEAAGLGADWQQAGTQDFTIPMTDLADSLNLSISAAVTLYEAFRQRRSLTV